MHINHTSHTVIELGPSRLICDNIALPTGMEDITTMNDAIGAEQRSVNGSERPREPLTMRIPEYGWKYHRMCRGQSYRAARNGLFVLIQNGALELVVVEATNRKFAAE